MSKKTLKQRQQAMMAESKSAQGAQDTNHMTQNEAKFNLPNQPSV
jgi:hypothetical protein